MSPHRANPEAFGTPGPTEQPEPEVSTISSDHETRRAGSLSKLILVSFPFLILLLLLLLDWWARGRS
jgi:hypothetical protein